MFEISKEFTFEAAHQLLKVPDGHKCGRLHGHSYRVVFVLASDTLNEMGFVVDYGELNAVKTWLDANWDHQNLNDLFASEDLRFETTAENLAKYLFDRFRFTQPTWPLSMVSVSETGKTWATYRPPLEVELITPDFEGLEELRRWPTDQTDALLSNRGMAYGDAWKDTGIWISSRGGDFEGLEEAFGIIMIYNKMCRALRSPDKADHYNDAIGYLKLAATKYTRFAPHERLVEKQSLEHVLTSLRQAQSSHQEHSIRDVFGAVDAYLNEVIARRNSQ